MLAYAVRFEVDEIILFYPNTLKQAQENDTELTIKDALAKGKEISVKAYQLPIINKELLTSKLDSKRDLNDLFASTREVLKTKIKMVLTTT